MNETPWPAHLISELEKEREALKERILDLELDRENLIESDKESIEMYRRCRERAEASEALVGRMRDIVETLCEYDEGDEIPAYLLEEARALLTAKEGGEACPDCGGLGHMDYPFAACPKCKGTGRGGGKE